jgi:hypothetical protein
MKDEWTRQEQRIARLADGINRQLKLDRWFISLDSVRWDRDPSISRVVAWLQTRLASLEELVSESSTNHVEDSYVDAAVELKISFIPRRSASPPNPNDRIVATGASIGGATGADVRIKRRLKDKSNHGYDLRDSPYAIFIGMHDPFADRWDLTNAIYGTDAIIIETGQPTRQGDGLFGISNTYPDGKNTRVSCIFAMMSFLPWDLTSAAVVRLDNPFARHEFPDRILPTKQRFQIVDRTDHGLRLDWQPPDLPA